MNRDTINELLAAVRAHCRGCCGGSIREVERCTRADCTLHPYRTNSAYMSRRRPESTCVLDGQMRIDQFAHLFKGDV